MVKCLAKTNNFVFKFLQEKKKVQCISWTLKRSKEKVKKVTSGQEAEKQKEEWCFLWRKCKKIGAADAITISAEKIKRNNLFRRKQPTKNKRLIYLDDSKQEKR